MEEKRRIHLIPLFPTPSCTNPDPEQDFLRALPACCSSQLTSLPHLALPGRCSCQGVLEANTLTHPWELCPGGTATVPSELQAGARGSRSRSDRQKDDSFPMFIPLLPIQQPSHFFSLLLCIQARFRCCSAGLDSSSLHIPQGLHSAACRAHSIPCSRPGPEQIPEGLIRARL